MKSNSGDWPEDAPHENGNYLNECLMCHKIFTGHKRRQICKACCTLDEVRADLDARITNYLCNGGMWNPEMMEHDKVRNLLMDVREYLRRDSMKRLEAR